MEHVLRFSEDSQQDLPLFFQAHASLLPLRQKRKRVESKKKKTELKERKEGESRSRLLLLRMRDHRNSKLFFLLFFRKTFGEERRKKTKKEKHQALPYHVVDRRVPFFSSVRRVALSLSLCLSLSHTHARALLASSVSFSFLFSRSSLLQRKQRKALKQFVRNSGLKVQI